MRVAITGATGFLGSHIVDRLLARGDEPVCLVRRTSDVSYLASLGVETSVGAIDDADSLHDLVRDCDAVIHSAAMLKASRAVDLWRCNVGGTAALVAAAADAGVDTIVHLSSVAAKGPAPGPQALPSDSPLAPISVYGKSKAAAEEVVQGAADEMRVRILRPPVLYGPRDMAILELFQALKKGLFPIPAPKGALIGTIYGPDCADAAVAALHHPGKEPLVVEPADAPGRTWEEFRDTSAKHMGIDKVRTLRPPPWAVHAAGTLWTIGGRITRRTPRFNRDKAREAVHPYWLADISSMRHLGWTATHDLDAGLEKTLAWYRAEGLL